MTTATAGSPYYGSLTRRVQRARLGAALRVVAAEARVLDVGCGLSDLAARFPSYVGCDRMPWVVEENRRRHPNASFHLWDVAASDPPAELAASPGFDAVLMLALLEHLADPGAALARVAPLLVPGGRVVTTTPHPAGRIPLEAGARLGLLSAHADEEHETLLDRSALEAAGTRAGLRLERYERFLLGLNQLAVFRAG